MPERTPVYSHNPNDQNAFPLLVLDVRQETCFPPNEGFRVLHWHEEIQFVHVLKGSVHMEIYGETFDVSAGDAVFLNRSVLHRITEKENCHYHSYLIPERMLGFFPGSLMARRDVASILHNPVFTYEWLQKKNPTWEEFFRRLDSLESVYFGEREGTHREYRICVALTALWLSFITSLPEKPVREPSRDYERIRAMISCIHSQYGGPLSVEEIAASAHIGKSECLRCFRRFTGESPYRYLLHYRLHMGAVLLKTTNQTVTEIALQTGFPSASSFIGHFQKKYGLTPHRYR